MRLLRFPALFWLVALTACGDSTSPEEDDLNAARRRWARAQVTTYTFVLARSCECTPEMTGPVRLAVHNGAVTSRHYVNSGAVVASSLHQAFPDITGLFLYIEKALRDKAYSLVVRYDQTLGYPSLISVDYDAQIADDEFVYTVSDLQRAAILESAR